MIRNRRVSIALAVLSTAILAACGSDDDDDIVDADIDDTVPPIVDETIAAGDCPTVGNLVPVELVAGECELTGVLTQDGTLVADQTWFLEGGLQVGTADENVTLTIEGGTQIRGDNVGEVDHVLVYPGSAMQANGTAATPIQFLSDDDNFDGSGEWGGIYLRGFNGLDALTGVQGQNILDYVVVAEAGAVVTGSVAGQAFTYLDNMVINGVDSNTTLTFVQSHNSARDGIRIQNGDPRMSWILATGSARDGIWYSNFTGLIKDLMVIHSEDADGSTGRSGIYAGETLDGDSNPRIVNATLVGQDSESVTAGLEDREFGILFADNTDQIRMGNVLIANFRNGCFEAATNADLSQIDTNVPGPNYIDGVHCANEAGGNPNFGIIRDDSIGFPDGTVAPLNVNADGIVYYNGAAPNFDGSTDAPDGGIDFAGESADLTASFTAGWHLNNIRGIANGLLGNPEALNGFLAGDTNNDGVVDDADVGSPFIIGDDGEGGFNQDVAPDAGGYDLTQIGAVRGVSATDNQFDGWTVDTGPDDFFTVQPAP